MTPSTILATSTFSFAILYVFARSILASLAFSRTSKNSRMSPSRFIFSRLYPDSDKLIFFLISSSSDRVGFTSLKAMCSPYRMCYGATHSLNSVSYTHLRAHETVLDLVCRLLLEKKKKH